MVSGIMNMNMHVCVWLIVIGSDIAKRHIYI